MEKPQEKLNKRYAGTDTKKALTRTYCQTAQTLNKKRVKLFQTAELYEKTLEMLDKWVQKSEKGAII